MRLMKMNLFNLISTWFVSVGILIAFTIILLSGKLSGNLPLGNSIVLYSLYLALLVDAVCLLLWIGIKRKFQKADRGLKELGVPE